MQLLYDRNTLNNFLVRSYRYDRTFAFLLFFWEGQILHSYGETSART